MERWRGALWEKAFKYREKASLPCALVGNPGTDTCYFWYSQPAFSSNYL